MLYDIEVKKSDGSLQKLEEYKGQALLIVNTASKCGFTPQFEGLQQLYDQYKERGFVVLGFPSDQFMNQEFDNQEEILNYCQQNYGVTFPMFHKTEVKGPNKNKLYSFLTSEKKGILGGEIKWNFTKFLVDKDGKVIKRYSSQTKPEKIKADIEKIL
ncbi:glutathione peroxidase [Bacillaceae bacterium W0354]